MPLAADSLVVAEADMAFEADTAAEEDMAAEEDTVAEVASVEEALAELGLAPRQHRSSVEFYDVFCE